MAILKDKSAYNDEAEMYTHAVMVTLQCRWIIAQHVLKIQIASVTATGLMHQVVQFFVI